MKISLILSIAVSAAGCFAAPRPSTTESSTGISVQPEEAKLSDSLKSVEPQTNAHHTPQIPVERQYEALLQKFEENNRFFKEETVSVRETRKGLTEVGNRRKVEIGATPEAEISFKLRDFHDEVNALTKEFVQDLFGIAHVRRGLFNIVDCYHMHKHGADIILRQIQEGAGSPELEPKVRELRGAIEKATKDARAFQQDSFADWLDFVLRETIDVGQMGIGGIKNILTPFTPREGYTRYMEFNYMMSVTYNSFNDAITELLNLLQMRSHTPSFTGIDLKLLEQIQKLVHRFFLRALREKVGMAVTALTKSDKAHNINSAFSQTTYDFTQELAERGLEYYVAMLSSLEAARRTWQQASKLWKEGQNMENLALVDDLNLAWYPSSTDDPEKDQLLKKAADVVALITITHQKDLKKEIENSLKYIANREEMVYSPSLAKYISWTSEDAARTHYIYYDLWMLDDRFKPLREMYQNNKIDAEEVSINYYKTLESRFEEETNKEREILYDLKHGLRKCTPEQTRTMLEKEIMLEKLLVELPQLDKSRRYKNLRKVFQEEIQWVKGEEERQATEPQGQPSGPKSKKVKKNKKNKNSGKVKEPSAQEDLRPSLSDVDGHKETIHDANAREAELPAEALEKPSATIAHSSPPEIGLETVNELLVPQGPSEWEDREAAASLLQMIPALQPKKKKKKGTVRPQDTTGIDNIGQNTGQAATVVHEIEGSNTADNTNKPIEQIPMDLDTGNLREDQAKHEPAWKEVTVKKTKQRTDTVQASTQNRPAFRKYAHDAQKPKTPSMPKELKMGPKFDTTSEQDFPRIVPEQRTESTEAPTRQLEPSRDERAFSLEDPSQLHAGDMKLGSAWVTSNLASNLQANILSEEVSVPEMHKLKLRTNDASGESATVFDTTAHSEKSPINAFSGINSLDFTSLGENLRPQNQPAPSRRHPADRKMSSQAYWDATNWYNEVVGDGSLNRLGPDLMLDSVEKFLDKLKANLKWVFNTEHFRHAMLATKSGRADVEYVQHHLESLRKALDDLRPWMINLNQYEPFVQSVQYDAGRRLYVLGRIEELREMHTKLFDLVQNEVNRIRGLGFF